MLSIEVKKYKENSPPYQINKLKLLMGKAFGRCLRKEEIDLTPEQLQVLGLIMEKETCSMQDISNELFVDNSAVTRLVDALEKKKFVKRIVSTEDRRVKVVNITIKGETEMLKTMEMTELHKKKLLEGVSVEDCAIFMKTLAIMQKNVEDFIDVQEAENITD